MHITLDNTVSGRVRQCGCCILVRGQWNSWLGWAGLGLGWPAAGLVTEQWWRCPGGQEAGQSGHSGQSEHPTPLIPAPAGEHTLCNQQSPARTKIQMCMADSEELRLSEMQLCSQFKLLEYLIWKCTLPTAILSLFWLCLTHCNAVDSSLDSYTQLDTPRLCKSYSM